MLKRRIYYNYRYNKKTTGSDKKESVATSRSVKINCPYIVDYIKLLAAAFSALHTLTLILLPAVMNLPYT